MIRKKLLIGLTALAVSMPSYGVQFSSILPATRSVQVGTPASFFGIILNTSAADVEDCAIFLATPIDAWFSYQATNPETNAPIGVINTPVSIAANSSQSFVLVLTPNSVIAPIDVGFTYSCAGQQDVAEVDGINTLLFSASSQPTPDIVAIAKTETSNGITELVQGETGFFTLSSVNLGTSEMFEVIPRITGVDDIQVSVCQTDPNTSVCLSEPTATASATIGSGETPTFALFLTTANLIELDASTRRVFVEFRDSSGQVRGSTSVAISSSQGADTELPPAPVEKKTIRITWTPHPEQNNTQLASYGIHFGTQSGNYTESVYVNPQDTAKDISVDPGTLYLSMTAESAAGERSAYSAELSIVVP